MPDVIIRNAVRVIDNETDVLVICKISTLNIWGNWMIDDGLLVGDPVGSCDGLLVGRPAGENWALVGIIVGSVLGYTDGREDLKSTIFSDICDMVIFELHVDDKLVLERPNIWRE